MLDAAEAERERASGPIPPGPADSASGEAEAREDDEDSAVRCRDCDRIEGPHEAWRDCLNCDAVICPDHAKDGPWQTSVCLRCWPALVACADAAALAAAEERGRIRAAEHLEKRADAMRLGGAHALLWAELQMAAQRIRALSAQRAGAKAVDPTKETT